MYSIHVYWENCNMSYLLSALSYVQYLTLLEQYAMYMYRILC